jgi:hypothetical protein
MKQISSSYGCSENIGAQKLKKLAPRLWYTSCSPLRNCSRFYLAQGSHSASST